MKAFTNPAKNALLANKSARSLFQKSSLISQSQRDFSFAYPCPRKLREIMKMSAIEKESPTTIETIWNTYH